MSKERSILFSAPMVRAILNGEKTQTRRIIKPQPNNDGLCNYWDANTATGPHDDGYWINSNDERVNCPYGNTGDLLWVRESHSLLESSITGRAARVWYWADGEISEGDYCRPRPSIHMFRADSRITLKITDVRVERLNDISEEDAKAEGVAHENMIVSVNCYGGATHEEHDDRYFYDGCQEEGFKDPVEAYQSLWESINSKGSWSLNPWVWVIGFNREDVKL